MKMEETEVTLPQGLLLDPATFPGQMHHCPKVIKKVKMATAAWIQRKGLPESCPPPPPEHKDLCDSQSTADGATPTT